MFVTVHTNRSWKAELASQQLQFRYENLTSYTGVWVNKNWYTEKLIKRFAWGIQCLQYSIHNWSRFSWNLKKSFVLVYLLSLVYSRASFSDFPGFWYIYFLFIHARKTRLHWLPTLRRVASIFISIQVISRFQDYSSSIFIMRGLERYMYSVKTSKFSAKDSTSIEKGKYGKQV